MLEYPFAILQPLRPSAKQVKYPDKALEELEECGHVLEKFGTRAPVQRAAGLPQRCSWCRELVQ